MPKIITEDMIEQAAIKALQERHDYIVLNCMTEEPDTLPDGTGRKDKKQVVLPDVMFESLCRINPDIPEQTVRTVVDELCRTPVSGDLMLTNYQNYQKIRNGITVESIKDNPTISVQSFWKIWCGCTWKQSSAISSAMKITSVQLCRNA